MSVRRIAAVVVVLALVGGCKTKTNAGTGDGGGPRKGDPLRVAAASDLAIAFKEVGAAFEQAQSKKVEFAFGSSGLFAKQIEDGASFDVFAAANTAFVDDVIKSGACLADSKAVYARGRLVLWSKDPQAVPKDIAALKDARYKKIALANPEHAPYGTAAQQALTKAGLLPEIQPRLVYAENVQDALSVARKQNADVAIVALSLGMSSQGNWAPVDPALHDPIDQALIACKGGSAGAKTNEARAFIGFVGSPAGRAIMKKYGFLLPGEEPQH